MSLSYDKIQREWEENQLSHEEYEQRLTRRRSDGVKRRQISRALENLYRALNDCGMGKDGTFVANNECAGTKGTGKKAEKAAEAGKESKAKPSKPFGKGSERSGVKYMGKKQKVDGVEEGEEIRIHDVMSHLSDENAEKGELEYTTLPSKKNKEARAAAIQKNLEAAELISDATADEIMYVHENGDKQISGEGWYEGQMDGAMEIMAEIYPELATGEDGKPVNPEMDFAFKSILAITSHNQDVVSNFNLADQLYQHYKEHKDFDTTFREGGKANKAMRGKMELLNHMTDTWGHEAVHKFMMTPIPVSEINKFMKEKGVPEELFKSVGSELKEYVVAGSVVFGPKLGSFYNNLNGKFDSVTMDLWFTRTMGRIGGVATKMNFDGIAKDSAQLLEAIEWASVEGEGYLLPEGLDWGTNQIPSKAKAKVIAGTPVLKDKPVVGDYAHDQYNRLFHEGMVEPSVVKGWLEDAIEDPRSAAENEELIEWVNSQRLRFGASKIPVLNPDGTPALDKKGKPKSSGYKDKTTLNRISKRLAEKLKPKKDAPDSGAERQWYRQVMTRTKEKLAARGVEMTYADLQAVLWFNEKNLMKQFGFEGKGSETLSYLDAAKLLSKEKKGAK